jgi:hypothetical protein
VNTLVEAITAAIADGASDEARATGAQACRTILAALEATAGEPLTASAPAVAAPAAPAAAIVGALRGMPAEQLLDLAIARLKAALPPGADVQPTQPLKFHIVPVPPRRG